MELKCYLLGKCERLFLIRMMIMKFGWSIKKGNGRRFEINENDLGLRF